MQSVLPVGFANRISNDTIQLLNDKIKDITIKTSVTYIDLYSYFLSENNCLNDEYSFDGLHLSGKGYLLWKKILEPYLD